MADIHSFPGPPAAPEWIIGPFEENRVVVEGRMIPGLTAHRQADGRVTLIVDRRFMVDFPSDEVARQAAWLVAQALAIGAGYSHLGAEGKDRAFAPMCAEIAFGDN
jgi:hypothetical protein